MTRSNVIKAVTACCLVLLAAGVLCGAAAAADSANDYSSADVGSQLTDTLTDANLTGADGVSFAKPEELKAAAEVKIRLTGELTDDEEQKKQREIRDKRQEIFRKWYDEWMKGGRKGGFPPRVTPLANAAVVKMVMDREPPIVSAILRIAEDRA